METENKKTNKGLVQFVKSRVGAPYWFGTYGQISCEELYLKKKEQYPKEYEWECKNNQPGVLPETQLGVSVFDCSGLIKAYLWTQPDGSIVYNPAQDISAGRMFETSPLSGEIETLPEKEGLLVFAKKHVGVYIGNGQVVDAKGHAAGVIVTKLKDRAFTHWGHCPWIEYI